MNIYGGLAPAPSLGVSFKGRVTLVLFFNAARDDSLNMISIVQSLKLMDTSIQVIGIHCHRFPVERNDKRLEAILSISGVDFTVYADKDGSIRDSYLIKTWPALVLVDPRGFLVWGKEELFHPEVLKPILSSIISMGRKVGDIVEKSCKEVHRNVSDVMMVPTRLIVEGNRIYVVDRSRNRLIVADLNRSGKVAVVKDIYGKGNLVRPFGMNLSGKLLYLVDGESNSLIIMNCTDKGVQFKSELDLAGGKTVTWGLKHPTQIALLGDLIYFSAMGTRKLWVQSLHGGFSSRPFAGTGVDGMDDGSSSYATIGQVEALISDGNYLYFSDSHSNSVRCVDPASGIVRTISGAGPSLYGLRNGPIGSALFQRPSGMCFRGRDLMIADSYNDRIRAINLLDMSVRTVYGDKRWQKLFTPCDVAVKDNMIYVADSGNGRIVLFDEDNGEPETLEFKGLPNDIDKE